MATDHTARRNSDSTLRINTDTDASTPIARGTRLAVQASLRHAGHRITVTRLL